MASHKQTTVTVTLCNRICVYVTEDFLICCTISVSRESNREVDAEIDAFLSSKSPKKPVDPLSYIKVREN